MTYALQELKIPPTGTAAPQLVLDVEPSAAEADPTTLRNKPRVRAGGSETVTALRPIPAGSTSIAVLANAPSVDPPAGPDTVVSGVTLDLAFGAVR